jgi:hypothetical protein
MHRGRGLKGNKMTELMAVILIGFCGFMIGLAETEATYQDKCVAKYADMPHNQVVDYCKKILKFEKDAK